MTVQPYAVGPVGAPAAAPERLFRAQQGVATRAQLLAAGVPPSTITHRCKGGVWQCPLPRVVVLHSGPLTWQQRYRAALLLVEPRPRAVGVGQAGTALLTGVAALALYRLRSVPAPEHVRVVDVVTPGRYGVRSRNGVRVHRTRRMPGAVFLEGRLPVAPLRRAVADAVRESEGGSSGQEADVAGLLHEVVQNGRLSPEQLVSEMRAAKLSGRADVSPVLDEVTAGTRSPAEGLARRVVLGADLPQPWWNPRLELEGEFLAVPDAYWPAYGVILEVDSKRHHWAVGDWEATMARHNRLVAVGFRVLHVSPRQLRDRPGEVVADLRAALSTGPHGPVDRLRVTGRSTGRPTD